ncbi:N5,N10-methylenetetrahydromethanopterin reductase-related protein, SCO6416-type [hydrothermal vent metagenome]|uniref:N5,N10-methylenetetrahydromethanopterin reductase-related protein, SCO6416-type n=1 Tax=hydrothermal vent metagenome TaxID=652676 RepID=A0A3B0T387_9ZZZZ
MDFGVVFQTDPPAQAVIDLTVEAEKRGFNYAWTFDSHVLWQEPFVIYSQMLAKTQNMTVGPMVTNPGTRDITVTASLFATLNEMYGERTVIGMGRGDSALRVIGKKPCRLAELGESIDIIRALAQGEEVEYNGVTVQFPWAKKTRVPMLVAAYGPKTLTLTGQKADGFILQLADPYLTKYMIQAVRDAAESAGRNPDDLYMCVAAPAYVGDDIAHQRDQVRWFGGMVGNHVADLVGRYGTDTALIPAELTSYIEGRKGYDYQEHGRSESTHVDFVSDDLIDRFCLLGPVENHIARLRELRDMGVDQFSIYLQHDGKEETLRAYGDEIIPAING